jgi:haloacetate dehalogenase
VIWREWADDVQEDIIDSGHHMAEEAPAELARIL